MKSLLLTSAITLLLTSTQAMSLEQDKAMFFADEMLVSIAGGKHDPAKKEIHLRELKVGNRLIQCTTSNLPQVTVKDKDDAYETSYAWKENNKRAIGYQLSQPISGLILKKSYKGVAQFEILNSFGLNATVLCQARSINNDSRAVESAITETEMKTYFKALETRVWSSSTLASLEIVKPGATSARFREMTLDLAVAFKKLTGRISSSIESMKSSAGLTADTVITKKLEMKELPESKYGIYISVNEEFKRAEEFTKFMEANKPKSNR